MPDFAGPGTPLSPTGASNFATLTGSSAADMWSVLSVETSGCGFLPDRRPKILFERHKFHALTGGIYDVSHPDISAPSAGGYGPGGANQYNRLQEALALDREAALKSASWGLGQIMGLNFAQAGYPDIETMVQSMVQAEDNQLAAMAQFLLSNSLAAPLAANDWTAFALGYNGPNYAANNYDGLLAQFHTRFTQGPDPDLRIRAAQMFLTYKGYVPRGIDGILGPGTRDALQAFQTAQGLPPTGDLDDATFTALSA